MTQEASPSLELVFQYLKDLSVENPSPRKFFSANQEQCQTRIDVDVDAQPLENHEYEVVLFLKISITENDTLLYMIEMQFGGIAKIQDANDEILPLLLFIQCPHLLFPYVRMMVSLLTQESGFPPLVLNPIDFAALFRQKVEQSQQSSS